MNPFKVSALNVKYETVPYEKSLWMQVDYKKVVQPEKEILICVLVRVLPRFKP